VCRRFARKRRRTDACAQEKDAHKPRIPGPFVKASAASIPASNIRRDCRLPGTVRASWSVPIIIPKSANAAVGASQAMWETIVGN
jgi:hypothetical protein